MHRLCPAILLPLLVASCAPAVDVPVVAESFITEADPAMNIDSVATHPAPSGGAWLFATAKDTHLVRVYNAANGALIRDLGGPGTALGQFQRPNGVLADAGMLIVVERNNQRVQLFSLPSLEPLTTFGETDLIKPYGGYLQHREADRYELFVTDAYETEDEHVPPPAELDHRVHRFELAINRDTTGTVTTVTAHHAQSFGETEGPGMLNVVESIWGDPSMDRLLIAEEDPAGGRVIKTYSFAGRYSGPLIGEGIFRTQPEGIALFACADGSGYWVTTDQDRGRNVFHLFDRRTLDHVGGFSGEATRNTDGIWLMQDALPEFPSGALYAVHDDQAVAAFDWRDIAAALKMPDGCSTR